MVTPSTKDRLPVVLVDVAGALMLGACLLGCAYFGFIKSGQTSGEIGELTTLSRSAAEDLTAARAACERQRAVLASHQATLASERQLPLRAPLEESIQSLSSLAETHRVHVLRQNPLAPRRYLGLLEQRFALEVSGTMPDLAAFFKAVEDAETWADIAYLKIINAETPTNGNMPERVATLTLSLFSADKAAVPTKGDG